MAENKLQISVLDKKAVDALIADARILSTHPRLGPKVFMLPYGDIVKVFNPKKGITHRHWYPKYRQFIDNAEKLHALHIKTVQIRHIYQFTDANAYAVRYTPLGGEDLRSLMHRGETEQFMKTLLSFMALLHDKGIYFRGLHLGNVLYCDTNEIGIIDMADMRFKNHRLSLLYRIRNIAHMVKRAEDKALFKAYGLPRLLNEYCTCAHITGFRYRLFMWLATFYHANAL